MIKIIIIVLFFYYAVRGLVSGEILEESRWFTMILEESGEFWCFLDDSGDSFLACTKKTVWTRIHIKQSFVNLNILASRKRLNILGDAAYSSSQLPSNFKSDLLDLSTFTFFFPSCGRTITSFLDACSCHSFSSIFQFFIHVLSSANSSTGPFHYSTMETTTIFKIKKKFH